MTHRKMSGEEVFVSAMNAAISGFMAASGNELIERAVHQKKVYGHMSGVINTIVAIVELASYVGNEAVGSWDEFCEDSEV